VQNQQPKTAWKGNTKNRGEAQQNFQGEKRLVFRKPRKRKILGKFFKDEADQKNNIKVGRKGKVDS
jgi:hypothetical protein